MAQKFLDATAAPLTNPLVGSSGLVRDPVWQGWFHRMPGTLNAIPSVLSIVDLHDQSAAITATDFSNGVIPYGIYRLSYNHRIDQAATTSSASQLTLTWTSETVTQTHTGTNLTGNVLTTRDSSVILIHADAGSAINYAVTYSSTGGTPMMFELGLALEYVRPRGTL